ncbi:hypothetical protein C8R47DRAFT_589375 [Mycena vitilis]|nr:hypothetical protein C8R47DRAFT_589375 [Mycena vitilis]
MAYKKGHRKSKKDTQPTGDEAEKNPSKPKALPGPKLRILGPKPPENVVASPSSPAQPGSQSPAQEENEIASPDITPAPPVSKRVLREALSAYLASKGREPVEPFSEPDSSDSDELEELMNRKSTRPPTVFENGVEEDEDEEDELQYSEDEDGPGARVKKPHAQASSDSEPEPDGMPAVLCVYPVLTSNVPEEFSLEFSVPFDGANAPLTVDSTTTYSTLVTKLADTMEVAPKSVHVAYRFSTEPNTAAWSHLQNSDHLTALFVNAKESQATTRSKKKFVVMMKDLNAPGGKSKGKGKDKAQGKNDKKEKKRKRGESESEDSDASDAAEVKKKKKKSLPQWVAELEQENACQEHGGHGCLKYTTGHVQLSKADLTTWAVFLQSGYPSTTEPPPKLQVGGNKKAATKAAAPVTPAAPAAPPVPMSGLHMHGMPPPPYGYPGYPWQPPAPWGFQTPTPSVNRGRYEDALSSPPQVIEDNRLFPRMTTWLEDLDSGPRGTDGHSFTQFVGDFEKERYLRVVDLVTLSIEEVIKAAPEMPQGTAAKILAYAKSDVEAIRKRERKRARKEAQPARYT